MRKDKKVCVFPNCGRRVRSMGLCQSHYKQQRTGEALRPVLLKRRAREETQRYAGMSLTTRCAKLIAKYARRAKCAPNAIITDIVEAWARKHLRE